jgi:hypothetical protein
MGLCVSAIDDYSTSSYELSEGEYSTSSYERSEGSISSKSMIDNEYLVVAGSRNMKCPGSFGISQLVFASDRALKLKKPLFGSGAIFKSQATFFQKTVTFYAVPLTEVTSSLFFGSFEDANNEEKLRRLGITHIISLIGPTNKIKGMKHKHKPMSDHGRTNLKGVITKLWPFILESQRLGNKLFVHCQSGQNRSATVVLSILMKLKNEKLDVLYRMIKKKRPVIQINEIYAKQLSEIECELFGETTVPKNWMSICSYDMYTGDVEFNDKAEMELSTEERASVPGNIGQASSKFKTRESPSVVNLKLSDLRFDEYVI